MENKIKKVIGIDASRSQMKQKTGTEYYSFELIRNLVKNKNFKFRLYSKETLTYLHKEDNIEFKVMHFPRLWSVVRLSLEILMNPPSVLFEPAHIIPLYHGKKTVITLHDVGFRHFPELYTPLERIYHNFCMRFSVKHATKIISISNATAKDLVDIYHANPRKINIVYHGFDKTKYFPRKPSEKPPTEISKFGDYIFFIGRLEAKKNIKNLIRSYAILRQDKKITHKLVLAGRPGYQYEEIKEEINKLPEDVRIDVIETGYVPDELVSDLTRFASIFFFPSYFEGFGMPVLEAMASGVPVVASNTTSIPEVMGQAGLLSDPNDPKTFAQNISKIINDNDLRQRQINLGLERSKLFDWDKCAQQTLDVIESAIES